MFRQIVLALLNVPSLKAADQNISETLKISNIFAIKNEGMFHYHDLGQVKKIPAHCKLNCLSIRRSNDLWTSLSNDTYTNECASNISY